MRRLWLVFGLLAPIWLPPLRLLGQTGGTAVHGSVTESAVRVWTVSGTVQTLRGEPVSGAIIIARVTNALSLDPSKIRASTPSEPTASATSQSLKTDLQGQFTAEFTIAAQFTELKLDLVVTKVGLRKAHQIVEFPAPDKVRTIPVTLRDLDEDPDLISQEELISAIAPRLKQLRAEDGRSDLAAKDYAHGMAELLDQDNPDQAWRDFASAAHRAPDCIACETMLGVTELASGNWDGAYRDLTEASNSAHLNASGARPEPLLILGVMESWKHEPKNAAGYFLGALKVAPRDPLALQELGRSQFLLQNWPTANQYLQQALAAGAGAEARLLRVQALMELDQMNEASSEMTAYLAGRNIKKMPIRVRQIWAEVRDRQKAEAAVLGQSHVEQPVEKWAATVPELKGLEPVQDQHSLEVILAAVGKNVEDFFRNFQSTVSREQVHQEKLRDNNKGAETQDQKFDYLCLTPVEKWGPGITEYRTDLSGHPAELRGLEQGFMLTLGFASASLDFHPAYQPDSEFRFLGRQKFNGRDAFVVAFAQCPAKTRSSTQFNARGVSVTVYSQGVAWIDAGKLQIVHLHTDLLAPLPKLRLDRLTTEIDFDEVRFKDSAGTYWMPREVRVAVDWNGKRLRNLHQYSEFKHFNVSSTGKVGRPNLARDGPESDR